MSKIAKLALIAALIFAGGYATKEIPGNSASAKENKDHYAEAEARTEYEKKGTNRSDVDAGTDADGDADGDADADADSDADTDGT